MLGDTSLLGKTISLSTLHVITGDVLGPSQLVTPLGIQFLTLQNLLNKTIRYLVRPIIISN